MLVDPALVETVLEVLGDSMTVIIILGEEERDSHSSFRRVSPLTILPLLAKAGQKHAKPSNKFQYPHHFQTKNKLESRKLPAGKHSKQITACILFSSGTSGLPKAVQISHFALISGLACMRASDTEFCNAEERSVSFAPLCHLYGTYFSFSPPLSAK